MSRSVLVLGANRGIGLNLCKQFAKHGWKVAGTIRQQTEGGASVEELKEITKDIFVLDYTDEHSIIQAAKYYGTRPLDVLINCAGVEPQPVKWQNHSAEILLEKFQIMAVGPFLASKHFFPALEKSKGKIINISSDMGSISRG
ncbi:hypothetical protein ONS95_005303 [Cadophora gregata]|uniref:uncharacterized protein n=1 Tax=Cadophora gregata TaxID=51156 RepID=UPI0026DB7BFF|nr:uncharacterized protein ONS95_005303 [Cadophora gregata]KAK0103270.1 hypothetical protein ONS95_005303 [Cadophora gregata]KAK0107463.1 hypothetical protein ONS96_003276 [Cadophora gregata f. sp. sojae]